MVLFCRSLQDIYVETLTMQYRLPAIEFSFWVHQNQFYSDKVLTQNVRIGLGHAAKGGLIGGYTFSSNKALVDCIAEKVSAHPHPDQFSDDELMTIFDLIQGWGGKTGRGPYVRPKVAPPRISDKSYPAQYRRAVELMFALDQGSFTQSEIDQVNQMFCKMRGIAQSYSTKHMCFWSRSLVNCPTLAIYDTRMVNIFRAANPGIGAPLTYINFLDALKDTGTVVGLRVDEVESALFAFSSNYFTNDHLKLRDDFGVQHSDHAIAVHLARTAAS